MSMKSVGLFLTMASFLCFCSGSMGKADGSAKMSAKDLYGKAPPLKRYVDSDTFK